MAHIASNSPELRLSIKEQHREENALYQHNDMWSPKGMFLGITPCSEWKSCRQKMKEGVSSGRVVTSSYSDGYGLSVRWFYGVCLLTDTIDETLQNYICASDVKNVS